MKSISRTRNRNSKPEKLNKKYNLFTFFTLYIAQSIPMSFFATALPVLMRQGNYSLWAIAMLKLIKLPWIVKFLWSPWIDSRCDTVRNYKRWIIGSELVYAGIILVVAFLRVETNFSLIITLVVLAFIASATQDIATDGMAARAFLRNDSSLLNSMQSMGSFTGSMVGGGFLLLVFQQIGWGRLLPWVGIFVLVALIPLWLNRKIALRPRHVTDKAKPKDMYLFFRQKNIWQHIVFLLLFYAGLIGILSTLRPYMVDLGYDMKKIGAMVGIFGTAVGICCSFVAGICIRKIGKNTSRKIISLLIVGVAAYFLWFSTLGNISRTMMLTGIGLLWGTYGMATTMVYTTSMDIVRDGREGTDFTLQIVITHLSSMIIAIGCSRFGDVYGFTGMFALELGIAIAAFGYMMFYRPKISTSDK